MEKIINNYVIKTDENGYVIGFYDVLDDGYNYTGQMADFPGVCNGYTKFIPGEIQGQGEFIIDEDKKQEILAEQEAEQLKPTILDRIEAQTVYSALKANSLIPDEDIVNKINYWHNGVVPALWTNEMVEEAVPTILSEEECQNIIWKDC